MIDYPATMSREQTASATEPVAAGLARPLTVWLPPAEWFALRGLADWLGIPVSELAASSLRAVLLENERHPTLGRGAA